MKYYKITEKDIVSFGETDYKIPENATEIKEEEYQKGLDSIRQRADEEIAKINKNISRLSELQDKAILEGLTDAEKEEYKKLKGGE